MCVSELLLLKGCLHGGRKILESRCQRKAGKMLKMSAEEGQQNIKFILTSCIGQVK